MIVAVDPGMATCGWAVIQPVRCELVDFGVITTERDPGLDRSTDRARRIGRVALELRAIVRCWGGYPATILAAEATLGFGTIHAVLPQALAWGALIALAVDAEIPLVEVAAKTWQGAIVPPPPPAPKPRRKKGEPKPPGASSSTRKATGAARYAAITAELAKVAGPRLERIAPALQTHALDAIGVGLFTALRPTTKAIR